MTDRPPETPEDEGRAFDQAATVGAWHGPDFRMTYRVHGSGPTLLLVPGIAGNYRNFCALARRLGRFRRVVIPTYPGDEPDDGADLRRIGHAEIARAMIGLLDHLEMPGVDVLGVSFGSTVTLRMLSERPGWFRRVVLQGGFASRRLKRSERLALAAFGRFPGTVGRLPMHDQMLWLHNRAAFPKGRPDLWRYFVEQTGRTPIRSLAHRLSLLGTIDLESALGEIPHPTLIVQGGLDRIVPLSAARSLEGGLASSSLVIFPEAGHQPHYTHPGRMAEAMLDHLGREVAGID